MDMSCWLLACHHICLCLCTIFMCSNRCLNQCTPPGGGDSGGGWFLLSAMCRDLENFCPHQEILHCLFSVVVDSMACQLTTDCRSMWGLLVLALTWNQHTGAYDIANLCIYESKGKYALQCNIDSWTLFLARANITLCRYVCDAWLCCKL